MGGVKYTPAAEKDLRRLPPEIAARIRKKTAYMLAKNSAAGKALKGNLRGSRRLRVGKYRVVYEETETGVLVGKIRHRKDSY